MREHAVLRNVTRAVRFRIIGRCMRTCSSSSRLRQKRDGFSRREGLGRAETGGRDSHKLPARPLDLEEVFRAIRSLPPLRPRRGKICQNFHRMRRTAEKRSAIRGSFASRMPRPGVEPGLSYAASNTKNGKIVYANTILRSAGLFRWWPRSNVLPLILPQICHKFFGARSFGLATLRQSQPR